jgi:hypothetical protein
VGATIELKFHKYILLNFLYGTPFSGQELIKKMLGRNYSCYYSNRTILKKQVSFQKNFTVCPVGVKGLKAHIIGDGWRTKHLKMKKKTPGGCRMRRYLALSGLVLALALTATGCTTTSAPGTSPTTTVTPSTTPTTTTTPNNTNATGGVVNNTGRVVRDTAGAVGNAAQDVTRGAARGVQDVGRGVSNAVR